MCFSFVSQKASLSLCVCVCVCVCVPLLSYSYHEVFNIFVFMSQLRGFGFFAASPIRYIRCGVSERCHYTKSNPIDDHSNISSKNVTEAEFQTIGPLYLHAVWYLPFTNSPRKHTVTYHFSDLQEVYSGNRQIHTKCQLKYLHPPHISTSGKYHCVIIHQTTKAT